MTKSESIGYIKGGKLHIMNRKRMNQDLTEFKDCDVTITIKKRGKRSILQNAYYWGVVVKEIKIRFREFGHDVDDDDVHSFLKQKVHYETIVTEHGEAIQVAKSTTEMNKPEMGEYIDRIRMWALQSLDIDIPEPNTQTEMF